MQIKLSNFKSIEYASLTLKPLTILTGPPAAGKSNILDALALIGYFNRFLLIDKEYGNNSSNLEPLYLISRFQKPIDLFTSYDLNRRIEISLEDIKENLQFKLNIGYEAGNLKITFNETHIPWNLTNYPSNPLPAVRNALLNSIKNDKLVDTRLYGFDRYGLAINVREKPIICGFHNKLRGEHNKQHPINILSEFAWNIVNVIKGRRLIINKINEFLSKNLDERIELKILRDGKIIIFEYDEEVETSGISDSIGRILYYLLALDSVVNYTKIYGLEEKVIVCLEEPEAHVFPFILELLIEWITKTIKLAKVVVTTHNPLLVSLLWDKFKDLSIYYTYRDRNGTTKLAELDISKFAKDFRTTDDLVTMRPKEIVQSYIKQG